ncbi:helix-turn-helix domain-containing protein [Paenibacillus sp.]|uniref:helix-turn-helix domain-containing protein n=1 Tax=Paenibacillus sp. TaxID=58172 RepID=UPI002810F852|nr:helix-turn-helix domain-containing protein [Paenibacillus sp.]
MRQGTKKRFDGFYKLLFSYLLILLIPIVIGAYVHFQTLNAIEAEAKRTGLAMLDQSGKIVDEQLNFILGITNRLTVNSDVLRFANVNLPLTDQNHYELMELSKELASHQYLNVYVKDILLHFKKSDTVLTTRGIFHGGEEYEYFLKYGKLSYEEWSAKMTGPGYSFHEPAIVQGASGVYETVAFTAPIHLGMSWQSNGAVVVYIDEAKIRELLLPLTNNTGGWAFAVNAERALMVSTDAGAMPPIEAVLASERRNGYLTYEGERYYVTSTVSRYSNWAYYSIIPEEVFLEKLNYIRQTILSITAISLLAGALTALYMSYRYRKPLTRLLRELTESGKVQRKREEDEFEYILNTYKNIANRHNDLKRVMERQLPMLRTVCIEKAMRGEFKSEEEARTFAERAKLALSGDRFLWAVARIEKYGGAITDEILQELHFNTFVIKNLANDAIGSVFAHDLSEDSIAFLICSSEADAAPGSALAGKLERLVYFVTEKFRMNVRFAVGAPQPRLADSWKSYTEAIGTLDFAEPNRVAWAELMELSDEYYYPLEIESKLVQTVKAGEENALDALLEHVYDGNFRQRKLSAESKQQLVLEMKGTVYKVAGQLQKNDAALRSAVEQSMERLGPEDAPQAFGSLSGLLRELHRYAARMKKDQGHELIHEMLAYVERHFDDANLSLSTLSTHFELTENYISFLFKDRIHHNFSTYLENLRMEKACEWLATTEEPVQHIAGRVGYNNDKSFRRAFKRVKGLQPTAYREQAQAFRDSAKASGE